LEKGSFCPALAAWAQVSEGGKIKVGDLALNYRHARCGGCKANNPQPGKNLLRNRNNYHMIEYPS
jgi:hypothetical protein